jgi:hypothetical protein
LIATYSGSAGMVHGGLPWSLSNTRALAALRLSRQSQSGAIY